MAQRNQPKKYANTAEWVPVFLAHLREVPNVMQAAKAANMHRREAYLYRQKHPEFAAEWDEIIAGHVDNIEGISFQQALDPNAQNTGMRIFLLKTWKRERYKDITQNELTGPDGSSLTIKVVYADTGPTDTDTPAGAPE